MHARRIAVTVAATLLMILSIVVNKKVDAVVVALFVIGTLPWLGGIVEKLKIGADSLEIGIPSAVATVALGQAIAASGEHESTEDQYGLIQRLSARYYALKSLSEGIYKWNSLNELFGEMISETAKLESFDTAAALRDRTAGRRLVGYARLNTERDVCHLDLLVKATLVDDASFSQYWGIFTIGQLVRELKASGGSPSKSIVSSLCQLRSTLKEGTDRRILLDNILSGLGVADTNSRWKKPILRRRR